LAALASSAVMRGCWALMLRFAAPVDLPFDAAFVNQGPLRWIARNSSKPGRSGEETWLLHARADWSEAHLEEDSESVAAPCYHAFGQLGGPPHRKLDCAPLALRRHRTGPRTRVAPGVQTLAWAFAETGSTAARWRVPGAAAGRWPNRCCGRSRDADGPDIAC
jgi:renalase